MDPGFTRHEVSRGRRMSGVDQLLEAATMLNDQLGIADALYRFAAGQDNKETATFLSAFTNDAVLDFSHPAQRFGVELPPMEGLDAIATIRSEEHTSELQSRL